MHSKLLVLLLLCACFGAEPAAAQPVPRHPDHAAARQVHRPVVSADPPPIAKKQQGKASYYSHVLDGKKMADGTRFNPASNMAASKTLPLGTQARVRNLENGKSAMVEIRDRGPYRKGRIIDVTPSTARQLGMTKDGVAHVEVEAVGLPSPIRRKGA